MSQYIKLEDVQKQIIEICSCWNPIIEKELLQSINSLQSISPESMIEEMIEKEIDILNTISREGGDYLHHPYLKETLEELLQKFNS